MPPFLSIVLSVVLFLLTRIIPAAFRITIAVVTWMFTFIEAHHAAILAALSFLGTLVLHADTWLLTAAKGGLAYFGTSAFAGLVQEFRGAVVQVGEDYVLAPIVDLEAVFVEEWARLEVAFRSFFPKSPPVGPTAPQVAPAQAATDEKFGHLVNAFRSNGCEMGTIRPAPDYIPPTCFTANPVVPPAANPDDVPTGDFPRIPFPGP